MQDISAPNSNPLQSLADQLDADMKAVNAHIISYMKSDVPLIPQLAGYIIASGGKRIRPLLTLACTALYNGEMTRAHNLAAAVEFIHTATLLHDDVVDESDTRRGKDTANVVFGNQASVLVGDFLFARAFQMMTSDGSLAVLKTLSDASAIITEGEVLQLSLAGSIETTMENYLDVIKAKTAALFAAACEVGPIVADQSDDVIKATADYGMYLGIAFQIADDALDYMADEETLGKAVGDDFREGKTTAPVLLALEKADEEERTFWKNIFENQSDDSADLKRAQDILRKHDAINGALDMAKNYAEKAHKVLDNAPDSALKTTLQDLTHYVVHRAF